MITDAVAGDRRMESALSLTPAVWRELYEIAATVARLEREHMIADTEVLTAALQRDLIDPDAFCR